MTPFMTIKVYLDRPPPKSLLEKAMFDLIADTSRERCVPHTAKPEDSPLRYNTSIRRTFKTEPG